MKRAGFIVAAVLLQGTAGADTGHTLAWRVGDTWTYQVEDLWKNQAVGTETLTVAGRNGDALVLRTATGASTFEEQVAADGRHDRPRLGIIGEYSHMPVRFPLKVGDRWKTSSLFQSIQGDIRKRELNCVAKGQETVTLKAGGFDAVFIECAGTWNSLQGYSARHETRLWYAPAVRWVVKVEERSWKPSTGSPGLDTQTRLVLTGHALKD